MRIELTQETHGFIKEAATKAELSIPAYMDKLIQQVGIANKDEKVILSIPSRLIKKDKEGLQRWLQERMDAIVKKYY